MCSLAPLCFREKTDQERALKILTALQACLISLYTLITGSVIVLLVALIRVPGIQDVAYRISKIYCWIVLKTCFVKLRVQGLEQIDRKHPYVFMSNHVSLFDIPAVAWGIPHSMRWVYKKELSTIPFLGWALRAIGHIMVDRQNRAKAVESLRKSLEKLKGNTSIMIYPEGTRSKTGELLPFKKGGFYTAIASGFPIVPIAIRGSREIMKKGVFRIHPGTITLQVFPPIPVEEYDTSRTNELKERVREIILRGIEGENPPSGETTSPENV